MPRFHPPGVRVLDVKTDKGRVPQRELVMDLRYPAAGLCFTHNNSVDNLLRGLGERLMMVPNGEGYSFPPQPEQGVYGQGALRDYQRSLLQKMPKFDGPITRDEFVALYDGPKRKRYQAALNNLVDRELVERDWQIQIFIKDEIVCSWNKIDPAPRLISPRSPEYCLELGRYIKPIEHLLYKAVARVWGEVTIAKGLNFNDRGALIAQKWASFDNPVAIGLDASRFDQHVSREALIWEHAIYTGCYKRSRQLSFLLSKQLTNYGVAYLEGRRIEYERDGGRMSGDMNTALGNCLIMTGLVWSYAREIGVNVKLINDGDDCVVFMEQRDLEIFQCGLCDWFRKRGFSMKVEAPAYELESIEFCQCHPVWNGEQYTMCRNVHKALFTDVAHVGRTPREIAEIRRATGLCGLAWSRGIPVFTSFYRQLSNIEAKDIVLEHSGTYWNSKGCHSGTIGITHTARISFYKAFGLTPSEQIAIEKLYDRIRATTFDDPTQILMYQSNIPSTEYPLFICESLNLLLFD